MSAESSARPQHTGDGTDQPDRTPQRKRTASPEAVARLADLRRLIAAQLKNNTLPHGL